MQLINFPCQRQFWGAHIWDSATLGVDETCKSELSVDYNKKALIFSPDSQIRAPCHPDVLLLLRTTHTRGTVSGRRQPYPWEVPDRARRHPCDLPAVIDCMKVYRAQKEAGESVYDEHGPVSRLKDYLRVDLDSEEFGVVHRQFGNTISRALPPEILSRIRVGLKKDPDSAKRGSVLQVEARQGRLHVVVLSNDLLRRARVPTVVCTVAVELRWHANGLEMALHPEILCGLDLDVVPHKQVMHDGKPLVLPEDIMMDLVSRVMEHVGP